MKLYALLIGINMYDPNSESPVSSLDACVNDVDAMKQFLKTNYPNLIQDNAQIKTLKSDEATRAHVIDGFKNHLGQAGKEDFVLVYYSGHGSYNTTAPEFQGFTANGQEETWVLHDSRVAGNFDLADKEIALLLAGIGRQCPHIVVIADSCHSSSVTRDLENHSSLKTRFASGRKEARPLDTYLDGAYLARQKGIVPYTKHLLLAACSRTEKAKENREQGVFTKDLLRILTKTGGQIKYSDLFVQARASVQSYVNDQTPQCEAYEGFDARQGFLGSPFEEGIFKRYPIRYENQRWVIGLGQAAGIESNFNKPVFVKVYDAVREGQLLGEIPLGYINVTESEIYKTGILRDNRVTYWGEPIALPIVNFHVYGEPAVFDLMQKTFDEAVESGIYLTSERQVSRFELKIESGNIVLYDTTNNLMIQGVRGTGLLSKKEILKILSHIARWQRVLDMQNKQTKIWDRDLDLKVVVDGKVNVLNKEGVEMEGIFTQNNENQILKEALINLEYDQHIPFKIQFANNSNQPLYAGFFHLSADYGIRSFYENEKATQNDGSELTLLKTSFTMLPEAKEVVDILKLIVSTSPIDKAVFNLPKLQIGKIIEPYQERDGGKTRDIGGSEPDWCTKNLTIVLERKKS